MAHEPDTGYVVVASSWRGGVAIHGGCTPPALSLKEAFRQAKIAAGWMREVHPDEKPMTDPDGDLTHVPPLP